MARLTVLWLCLAAGLYAQAPTGAGSKEKDPIAKEVKKLRRLHISTGASRDAMAVRTGRYRQALLSLIKKHRPGGRGKVLDVGLAYAALGHPSAGLRGAEARRVVQRILLEDPETWAAWKLLRVVLYPTNNVPLARDGGINIQMMGSVPGMGAGRATDLDIDLLVWALRLRGETGLRAAASDAVDLLFVEMAQRRGIQANRLAQRVLASPEARDRAMTEITKAARLMTSNVTLPSVSRRIEDWPEFRKTWHRLDVEQISFKNPRTVECLAALGEDTAMMAALCAAASGARSLKTLVLPEGNHAEVVDAWYRAACRGDTTHWMSMLKVFKRPNTAPALALIDALYDVGARGPRLIRPLTDLAVRSKDWRTRSMALRTLASQDTSDPPRAISRLRRNKVWQVRHAYAEALLAYRHRDTLDELVQLLGDRRLRIRRAAAMSLRGLTGHDYGPSQKRWKKWVKEHGQDALPDRATAFRMLGGAKAASDRRYARYFGMEIPSNRVVFVLDKSESMYWGLWDGAVNQMSSFLKDAGPTTSFGAVEFAEKPTTWKRQLVASNASAIKKSKSFLVRGKPLGPTNVIDSLRAGWTVKGADAIVLLSDGLPNRGDPKNTDAILAAVRRENRYLRCAIHTVQMLQGRRFPHDAPRNAETTALSAGEKKRRKWMRDSAASGVLGGFLSRLARENEGDFGVGFGDTRLPPPGTRFRRGTDN